MSKHVLVTGANGFVGRNLCEALARRSDVVLERIDVEDSAEALEGALRTADVVFHLAGVNRPKDESEFLQVNTGLTETICRKLADLGRAPQIVLASSIQAEMDNPYGRSKRLAEQALERYAGQSGAAVVVFRLKNLFGKWCRPNYNAVTATFCHNIAHDRPIEISDPSRALTLTYVDDVVHAFLREMENPSGGFRYADGIATADTTLGELAALIRSFRNHRTSLILPDFSKPFVRALYATYLSYLEPDDCAYTLVARTDPRGGLAEFVKQAVFGQIFVSRTKPGISRGNHYHDTKTEKFLVVEGQAVVRLRAIRGTEVHSFAVRGEDFRVVDIPPGYTHSIENVGTGELVTLFWASEIFDPNHPDTFAANVLL